MRLCGSSASLAFLSLCPPLAGVSLIKSNEKTEEPVGQLEHIEAIEKRLWNAADTLRANSSLACKDFVAVQVKIEPVDATQFIQKSYEMPHESCAQSALLGAIHV